MWQLQHRPVVNEADKSPGGGSARCLITENVQDFDRERGKFAVLNEFTEIAQALDLIGASSVKNRVNNGALESLASSSLRQLWRNGEDPVFGNFRHSVRIDSTTTPIVADFAHEGGNLLHEPVHARLSCLQQRRYGQRCDGSVGVGDERFHVIIAFHDAERMRRADLVQGPDGGNLIAGFEELSPICSVTIAGVKSSGRTSGRLQIALAASNMTISLPWRRQLSRKWYAACATVSSTLERMRVDV